MSKFFFKRELDPFEIIKALIGVVAAVVIFFAITRSELDLAEQSGRLELAWQLPDLIPTVHNNYANQLSADGSTLEVRVYFRVTAKLPIYVHFPNFGLISPAGDTLAWEHYRLTGQKQFMGVYAPGSSYQLRYYLHPHDGYSLEGYRITMSYRTEVPSHIDEAYQRVFDDTPEKAWSYLADSVMKFETSYEEQVYTYGSNDIWDDFFENPR